MRTTNTRLGLGIATILLAACGGAPESAAPPPSAAPAPASPTAGAIPDTTAAPSSAGATPVAAGDTNAKKDDDGHTHEAPHGGALLELGDHFGFLELVVDPDAGTATLYVLDGEAEKAVRVAHPTLSLTMTEPAAVGGAPLVLVAQASSLTGETVGDSSQFVVTHAALRGVTMVKARLATITVKGQTFTDLALEWPDDHED